MKKVVSVLACVVLVIASVVAGISAAALGKYREKQEDVATHAAQTKRAAA